MIDKDCPAYNANYELKKDLMGFTGTSPIYAEKEVIVSEYCSQLDVYSFDCSTCPVYRTKVKLACRKSGGDDS